MNHPPFKTGIFGFFMQNMDLNNSIKTKTAGQTVMTAKHAGILMGLFAFSAGVSLHGWNCLLHIIVSSMIPTIIKIYTVDFSPHKFSEVNLMLKYLSHPAAVSFVCRPQAAFWPNQYVVLV